MSDFPQTFLLTPISAVDSLRCSAPCEKIAPEPSFPKICSSTQIWSGLQHLQQRQRKVQVPQYREQSRRGLSGGFSLVFRATEDESLLVQYLDAYLTFRPLNAYLPRESTKPQRDSEAVIASSIAKGDRWTVTVYQSEVTCDICR